MKIFTATEDTIWFFIVLAVITLLLGYFMHRSRWRYSLLLSWLWLILSTCLLVVQIDTAPSGFRMFALIIIVLFGLKVVAGAKEAAKLDFLKWIPFAGFWFGMRPAAFRTLYSKRRPGAGRMIFRGCIFTSVGASIIVAASFFEPDSTINKIIATSLAFIGLSIFVHFGILTLCAGFWKNFGAETYPLFNNPLRSRSLSEFWGRRWNLAFIEMGNITVFRPLKKRVGHSFALMATFGFSGVLHELAISLPVKAGYGLPTLYFLLQAGLVYIEKGHYIPWITRNKLNGRIWTFFWLILPFPLLFHIYFLQDLLWPFLGNIKELVELELKHNFSID